MHYHSLVVIPSIEVFEEPKQDKEIADLIKKMELEVAAHPENIFFEVRLNELRSLQSPFARCVDSEVEEIMAPYCNEDNEYTELEFDDSTQWLRERYEKELVDCIQLPEGKIVDPNEYPYCKVLEIVNGKVCQKNAGPVKHTKRTRKCRKMKALLKQPMSKIYHDFHTFATEGCGYAYDEAHDGYGNYYNPNVMWDWYVIGGRWPKTFLVKKDCKNQAPGQKCWGDESSKYPVPDGYIWTSAARKRDIEWEVMAKWHIRRATESFYHYEKMFESQEVDNILGYNLTDQGITHFGDIVYRKGETLEEFLKRCSYKKDQKYPVYFSDLIDEENWKSSYDVEDSVSDSHDAWENVTEQFIDGLDDDNILVSVDYHM